MVRRRAEIATLRSLGVDGSVLFFTYLLEAFALGLLGSVAGVGVGQVLAMGAVGMLADTVNALYFATSVEALRLTFTDVLVGIVLGLLFSMIAGWLPARDANQTPPAQVWPGGLVVCLRIAKSKSWSLLIIGGLFLLIPPVVLNRVRIFSSGFCLRMLDTGGCITSGHVLVVLSGTTVALIQWRLPRSRLQDGSSVPVGSGWAGGGGSMVTGMFQMIDSFHGQRGAV